MDTDDDAVVRWVASQSPVPALQALMKEAQSSPSRPSKLPAPTFTTTASLPPRTSKRPSVSVIKATQDQEPEAIAFVELLKDAFKKLDENALKKQRRSGPSILTKTASAPPFQTSGQDTDTDMDDDDSVCHSLSCLPPPKPTSASLRTRTGPPPLGMRRAPQPSQYSFSQGTKSMRFKPPLLTNKVSRPPPPRTKPPVAPQDPDSSFDVSFDMDVDALEEAMRAYD